MNKRPTAIDFEDWAEAQLKKPEVKKEYDALGPEFALVKLVTEARMNQRMSQKELAKISGVDQAVISKIETGAREPGVRTLEKIANSLGYTFSLSPIAK